MFEYLKIFGRRHPLVCDAMLWAIPAMLLGAVLRGLLLSYQPYAYWGSDSESYFAFADYLLSDGVYVMNAKRRYVYPLLLLPVSILPGSTLQWLAWLQHAFGLCTLVPLAYVARKSFVCWRVIVPIVTLTYASLPMVVWYEHELLGENVFYAGFIWAMAGWAAWTSQSEACRARRLWWWFFAGFAVVMLTKPSGRFIVPGVLLALVAVRAWRTLTWLQFVVLLGVIGISQRMGTDKQSSWLLYSSCFPLTRLGSPLHAEYKAEIRDLVTDARANIDRYFDADDIPKEFLKYPKEHADRPLWAALGKNDELRSKIYQELAMEAIRSEPHRFLLISARRILHSARLGEFKIERFRHGYFLRKLQPLYEELAVERPTMLWRLFDLPENQPVPAYADFATRLTRSDTDAERRLTSCVRWIQGALSPVVRPEAPSMPGTIIGLRIAPVGWLILAGALLAVLPPYRRNIAYWLVIVAGYLLGVFLVGSANPRFFGAAWPPIILAATIPLDLLARLMTGKLRTTTVTTPLHPPSSVNRAGRPTG